MKRIAFGFLFSFLGLLVAVPSGALASSGYVGVGVTLRQDNQVFTITDVKQNGPAARVGVLPGDVLIRIDGRPLAGLNLDNVVTLMRGDIGSPITLTLFTNGSTAPRDLVAIREYIEVPCFVEGFVNLRIQGDDRWGTISGYIGNDYVNWSVSYGRVSAYLKGEYLTLQLQPRLNHDYDLTGWIHNQYMHWSSFGGSWSFYQACIPD